MSVCGAQQARIAAVSLPEPTHTASIFQNPIPPGQLKFLLDYKDRTAGAILKDNRFRSLMKLVIPKSESRYCCGRAITNTLVASLEGDPIPIQIRDGRFVIVASGNSPTLNGHGIMWFDLQDGIAIGGVYSHSAEGNPRPELAVFSSQLRGSSLSMSQFPTAFQKDLTQWIFAAGLYVISTRYFIPENGRKYALLHDEDYCIYRQETPPPPHAQCEELKAEAAEVDMNAVYSLAKTQNAAYATPRVQGEDQLAWISLREQSCGLGPAGLQCRLRLTRQRTQALIASQSNPSDSPIGLEGNQ